MYRLMYICSFLLEVLVFNIRMNACLLSVSWFKVCLGCLWCGVEYYWRVYWIETQHVFYESQFVELTYSTRRTQNILLKQRLDKLGLDKNIM